MRILDNIWLVQEPFQLGAVILDKLISDIKAKLPLKKKQDDDLEGDELQADKEGTDANIGDSTSMTEIGDLDEDSTESGDNSLLHKLKSKLKFGKKAAAEDEEEGGKAKKKPPVIFIIVALGVIALLFLPDEEKPAPAPVVAKAKGSKRKKTESTETTTEAPKETTAVETATTETPTDSPVEVTSTETPPTETPPTETTPIPTETAPDTSTTETIPTETTPIPTEIAPDTSTTETIPTETTSVETAPTETTPSITGSQDTVDGETKTPTDENITEKILEDLEKQAKSNKPKEIKKEYIAPPDYEWKGRGLVYNCGGKHWACVDAPSYKTCEQNSSSVQYLKKSVECYPFNIYESQKGCEAMQNRMVSSSAKTNFCSGN